MKNFKHLDLFGRQLSAGDFVFVSYVNDRHLEIKMVTKVANSNRQVQLSSWRAGRFSWARGNKVIKIDPDFVPSERKRWFLETYPINNS